MANEKRLYRIELIAHQNLPKIDTAGMLMTNEGIAYVKIHPVTIKARAKADAVEVVRCKDCKHFIQEEHGCNHFGYYSHTPWVDEVDFCSYGERKDNERKTD